MSTHTLPRPLNSVEQDALTLAQQRYIRSLIAGERDLIRPDVRPYELGVETLEQVYKSNTNGHRKPAVEATLHSFRSFKPGHPMRAFVDMLDSIEISEQPPALQESSTNQPSHAEECEYAVPPLPQNVKANEARASEASPILDAMIDYFYYWATRSYEGYHEAVAIWVLATIAARRVVLPWQDGMWTTFYIMLVSKSGRHAKTKAGSYGAKVIRDCGLGFLLAPDETTPQQLLSRMSGKKVPRNYSCMTEQEKEELCLKLAFSAQKGLQYDEFGDFLQDVITSRGYNNLFYRLLKQMYDNKPELTYDTVNRGDENIKFPSLNIIGTTAPESLAGIAKKRVKYGQMAHLRV